MLLFQQQLGEISHIMMILGFQSLQLGNGVLVQRSIVLSNWYLLLRLQSLSYVACFLFLFWFNGSYDRVVVTHTVGSRKGMGLGVRVSKPIVM